MINKRHFKYLDEKDKEEKTHKYTLLHDHYGDDTTKTANSYSSAPYPWVESSLSNLPYESRRNPAARSSPGKGSPESKLRSSRNPNFLRNNYINKV